MTTQAPNTLSYLGEPYSISRISHGELFSLHHVTDVLHPVANSTACQLGYNYWLVVVEERLYLDVVEVDLSPLDRRRIRSSKAHQLSLLGVHPQKRGGDGRVYYDNLNHPIDYTGGVLVGRGWWASAPGMSEVRLSAAMPWSFTAVLELVFEEGRLVAAHDRSAAFAGLRNDFMVGEVLTRVTSRFEGELAAWMRAHLACEYDLFLW